MLSDFVKVRTVGRGSFGEALLVQHRSTGRELVLKRVRLIEVGSEGSGDAAESAMREAEVLQNLQHPNIVEFLGAFADPRDSCGTTLCLLMAYCEGGDLQLRLQRTRQEGKRLRESLVLRWFDQLCSAVAFVHKRQVLHRDLKPSNIFLAGGGRGGINKLAQEEEAVAIGDFGVARPLTHAAEMVMTMVGTPCYLSPEVCKGKAYAYKSDVWSLGCILFEMMALRPPFGNAPNLEALVSRIVRADFMVPDTCPTEYPEALRCVRAILRVDPDRRPSADALLNRQKPEAVGPSSGSAMPANSLAPPASMRIKSPVKVKSSPGGVCAGRPVHSGAAAPMSPRSRHRHQDAVGPRGQLPGAMRSPRGGVAASPGANRRTTSPSSGYAVRSPASQVPLSGATAAFIAAGSGNASRKVDAPATPRSRPNQPGVRRMQSAGSPVREEPRSAVVRRRSCDGAYSLPEEEPVSFLCSPPPVSTATASTPPRRMAQQGASGAMTDRGHYTGGYPARNQVDLTTPGSQASPGAFGGSTASATPSGAPGLPHQLQPLQLKQLQQLKHLQQQLQSPRPAPDVASQTPRAPSWPSGIPAAPAASSGEAYVDVGPITDGLSSSSSDIYAGALADNNRLASAEAVGGRPAEVPATPKRAEEFRSPLDSSFATGSACASSPRRFVSAGPSVERHGISNGQTPSFFSGMSDCGTETFSSPLQGGFAEDPKLQQRREDRTQRSQALRDWLKVQRSGKGGVSPRGSSPGPALISPRLNSPGVAARTEIYCPGLPVLAAEPVACHADASTAPDVETLRPVPNSARGTGGVRAKCPPPPASLIRGALEAAHILLRGDAPASNGSDNWIPPQADCCATDTSTTVGTGGSTVAACAVAQVAAAQTSQGLLEAQDSNVSIVERMEGIRANLEARMGIQRFQKLYRFLATGDNLELVCASLDGGSINPQLQSHLDEVLRDGPENKAIARGSSSGLEEIRSLVPLVAKLIACESSYFN